MVRSADDFCCLYQAGQCEYNLARSRSLNNMAAADFPQFSRLPPEIRNAIWREAALEASEKRLLILGSSHDHMDGHWDSSQKSIHVSPQMRQSAVFMVNRESRRAARHIYDVSLHVYSMSQDPNNYCVFHSNGDGPNLAYKGEVYISLVHDVFVELDDTEVHELDWDVEVFLNVYENLVSYPLTGRLSTHQTNSIKRLMVIHWLDFEGAYLAYLSDQSMEESEPGTDYLIDRSVTYYKGYYGYIDDTFTGASSRYDLYLDLMFFDAGTLEEILHGSVGMLLQDYLGGHRFGVLRHGQEDHDL